MIPRKAKFSHQVAHDADGGARITMTRGDGYLSDEDVVTLTGLKNKRRQVAQLLIMKISFAVTICGDPIVPTAGIEGRIGLAKRQAAEVARHTAEARKSLGLI